MRYHRDAHNKSVQKENPLAQNNPTGTKRKRTAAQNNPASAKKRPLASPEHTISALEDTDSDQENTLTVQNNPPVAAAQPQNDRNGLENSPIKTLPAELRLAIIQLQLQNPRKVAIVAKSTIDDEDDVVLAATSSESSLVFATRAALSKTCHDLHVRYADELESQVMSCKIPNLDLHVRDFDFAPFIRDLFRNFKDSHRAFFNAGPGVVTIHLTLTPSFFAREGGEIGKMRWLAGRDVQRTKNEIGLSRWLKWRAAEEKAGRKVNVAYELKRNADVEGVEDREALRMFILLFDPYSKGEGEIGDIVREIIRVYRDIKDREDHEAQEGLEEVSEQESEYESEDESEEELEEEMMEGSEGSEGDDAE